jgi:hypothetical protein
MASLTVLGITDGTEVAMVADRAQREYECEPGMVPVGDMEMIARVCSDCFERSSINAKGMKSACSSRR